MNKKVTLIIQARMGSSRLPGKSMLDLAGAPLIGRILERVKRCKAMDEIVLATPESASNDQLAELAKIHEVSLFRGSENDLVDRYYQAARKFGASYVCRLPADNPVPEPEEMDRMVATHIESGLEFSSNLSQVFSNGYPDGTGVEVYNFDTLETVWQECTDLEKREHVHLSYFNYVSQQPVDPRFRVGTVQCPANFRRPELILDVNTMEQYEFIRQLYEYLYPQKPEFHIIDVVRWYDDVYMKTSSAQLNK
jgi:spore coat polysaccharide biosynthesis protein SpsF